MRDATRIKNLATDALKEMESALVNPASSRMVIRDSLLAIEKLSREMDARTGTKDPSWWERFRARIAR